MILKTNARVFNGKMKDIPCFIIGNSPFIKDLDLSILENYFTIGINRILDKIDPTILLWQDLSVWQDQKKKILKSKALKYCREGASPGVSPSTPGFYFFKLQGKTPKLSNSASVMCGRGATSSVAYQFACALGCQKIALLGMDCKYDKFGNTDHYGRNRLHRKSTLPQCKESLRFIKANRGSRIVYNCSGNSIFTKRYGLREAIEEMYNREYTRDELEKILLS